MISFLLKSREFSWFIEKFSEFHETITKSRILTNSKDFETKSDKLSTISKKCLNLCANHTFLTKC